MTDETKWICRKCGMEVNHKDVIAKGYGHTVTVFEDGEYREAVCGPCDPVNTHTQPAQAGSSAAVGSALMVGQPIILTRADYDLCLGSGELKPCPFCGDIHPMSFGEKTPNGKAVCWKVQCTHMGGSAPDCCASVWHTDRDQAIARVEAVKKWNRRPSPNTK